MTSEAFRSRIPDINLHSLDRDKVKANSVGIRPLARVSTSVHLVGSPSSRDRRRSQYFVTAIDTNPLAVDPVLVLQRA